MALSGNAIIERAYVRRAGHERGILLPEDIAWIPTEGSAWRRYPFSHGRVMLVIDETDLAELALDIAERVRRGEKVGDKEHLVVQRMTDAAERWEAAEMAARLAEIPKEAR